MSRFDQLFDQQTKQDEVFEAVAKPVIDKWVTSFLSNRVLFIVYALCASDHCCMYGSCLQGYNGTIFAYGQVWSFKDWPILPQKRGGISFTFGFLHCPPKHCLVCECHIMANIHVCCPWQTGSGKTFTITGGAERYSDRGIIPRTLSYLFQQFAKVSLSCSPSYNHKAN